MTTINGPANKAITPSPAPFTGRGDRHLWRWEGLVATGLMAILLAVPAIATAQTAHDHSGTFRALKLDIDHARHETGWDFSGWVGGNVKRLWLKSEGEIDEHTVTHAETWVMAGRQVATFWDAQIGLRQDAGPNDHGYLVMGVTGLAPYFFEAEAHLFVREDGALSARLHQENDVLLTNRLILSPSIEANFNARADDRDHLGTGLTHLKAGLKLRYDIRRGFAPYASLEHEDAVGGTADRLKTIGEKPAKTRLKAGIRFVF